MMKKVTLVVLRSNTTYIPVRYGHGIVKNRETGKWYFQLGNKYALIGETNYDLFKEVMTILGEYRPRWRKKKPIRKEDTTVVVEAKKFFPVEEEA